MVKILGLLLLFTLKNIEANKSEEIPRSQEILHPPPIVYPFGGTFKLILGFAVPVQLSGKILVYGQNFQFQYALPQNATFFTNFFKEGAASRRRRKNIATDERTSVYNLLEQQLQRKSIDGKSCLKKSICEAAAVPLKDEGLIGELLHLLLTPNLNGNATMDAEYLDAAEFGRSNEDCSTRYSACPAGQGILDQISTII